MKILTIISVLLVSGYYIFFMYSPSPEDSEIYDLDLQAVRALSETLPGAMVEEIRVEQVAEFAFSKAVVMAGESWESTAIPVYSYQFVFPDHTMILDTALASMEGMPAFVISDYYESARDRMWEAMRHADHILLTHEHVDHIGGLLSHPNLSEILPSVRLTREQLDNPERMRPQSFPAHAFEEYSPLEYDGMRAFAPGVVLIKAEGHTPGSQMVFVRTAAGEEVLFIGDVAWQMRNIRAVRARPLMTTLVNRENRKQVLGQFKRLHAVMMNEKNLHLIPGHDAAVVEDKIRAGVLVPGFR